MKVSRGREVMRVVVTAGPTREHLDPVRFLSNPSTGKMGFAVAEEAAKRGYDVVLVAGPVSLPSPRGVERVDVISARDMLKAVRGALRRGGRQVLVSAAAIADWRPKSCSAAKLKKRSMDGVLELVRNPDVLRTVRSDMRRGRLPAAKLVGFAAETGDPLEEAVRKCRSKRLEFIVANDVSLKDAGFAVDTNRAMLVFPDGEVVSFGLMSKRALARIIVDALEDVFRRRQGAPGSAVLDAD